MTIIRPVIRDIITPVIRSVLDPGVGVSDIATIQRLLFGDGQPGVAYIPSLSPTMISANTFGTGVQTLVDLRGLVNATQATAGSRPAWMRVPEGGRRNLLSNSINFQSSPWTAFNSSVTAGEVATITAEATTISIAGLRITSTVHNETGPRLNQIEVKPLTHTRVGLTLRSGWAEGAQATAAAIFELSNGAIINQRDNATITPLADGWFRVSVQSSVDPEFTQRRRFLFGMIDPAGTSAGGTDAYAFDGSEQILVREPQASATTTATPYQRVTTDFDVTESGKRSIYGLRADGIDDSMVTPSIDFSGVDKVTVFAAVRKLSDAARGTIVELGTSIDSNNGSFHLTAPNAASATFGFESKGTTLRDAVISSKASPIYAVLTAEGDIAGDLARLQFNDETAVENTGDQGSGNYSNAVLNLFRRGGASLPLNGDCFALIVAGGSYDSATKNTIKAIIAKYTPAVTL